jgi:threonine dehydrogenase-like Zn-dependent dehydrogenase
MAGICNTDLEIVRGYMDFSGVPGHEFVGDVVEATDPFWIGKRVVGGINCPCLTCEICQEGLGNHCPQRTVLGIHNRNGAFAEYLVLPESNLYVVPDSVEDEEAVWCEPLAAAFQILEQVPVRPSDRVAVLGDGKLGSLIAQVLALSGCDLVVLGLHAQKLSRIRSLGVPALHAREAKQRSMDIVVDATGSPTGFSAALQMLKPRGTLVLKSTVADKTAVPLASLVIDEMTVVGSRCGPFTPALRALDKGKIRVRDLVQEIVPFDRALEAFERAARPGSLKILLDMREV